MLCRGEEFASCFNRGEYNSVHLSVVVVPAQQEQQDMSSGLCIITAKINGSVLSTPNCFHPFFFLMNEERDSILSSATSLLATTVTLPLKDTLYSSWQRGCGELKKQKKNIQIKTWTTLLSIVPHGNTQQCKVFHANLLSAVTILSCNYVFGFSSHYYIFCFKCKR